MPDTAKYPGGPMRALLQNRQRTRLMALALAVAACAADAGGRPRAVRVAVAGNFAAPLAELAQQFTEQSGIPVEASIGATGQLYAQVVNGAPFDVFLGADDARPALLEREGLTASGSRFTYAIGRLVLFVPGRTSLASVEAELRGGGLRALAIANPHTAPYGAAAQQVLERLGLWDSLRAVFTDTPVRRIGRSRRRVGRSLPDDGTRPRRVPRDFGYAAPSHPPGGSAATAGIGTRRDARIPRVPRW